LPRQRGVLKKTLTAGGVARQYLADHILLLLLPLLLLLNTAV